MKCPRCFWLDVKHGVKRPPGFPFTINSAIDYLFKQEFDIYRKEGKPHPVMVEAGIDAVPYNGPEMDNWRDALRNGVIYHHPESDITLRGGVDDVWINPAGELIVVDYKSTGSSSGSPQIYDEYVRQLEVYQWLLSQNKYKVSPVGYWVYAQADKSQGFGHGKPVLPFNIFIKSATGKWDWIPEKLMEAKRVLDTETPPDPGEDCMGSGNQAFCKYRQAAVMVTHDAIEKSKSRVTKTKRANNSRV